jgi:hypothetical protein
MDLHQNEDLIWEKSKSIRWRWRWKMELRLKHIEQKLDNNVSDLRQNVGAMAFQLNYWTGKKGKTPPFLGSHGRKTDG